jgi:hypothetical protein
LQAGGRRFESDQLHQRRPPPNTERTKIATGFDTRQRASRATVSEDFRIEARMRFGSSSLTS